MPEITIKQAITGGWASRSTIYRAIKDGDLSIRKDIAGRTYVDVSELTRAFGEPRRVGQENETNQHGVTQTSSIAGTAILQERLDSLTRERDRLERDLAEAKERESRLFQQLERQTVLLTNATAQPKAAFWGLFPRKKPS